MSKILISSTILNKKDLSSPPQEYNNKLIIIQFNNIVDPVQTMNLSARIKYPFPQSKQKQQKQTKLHSECQHKYPNTIHKFSGDFTFSPSHYNKKLKLEIPSARTTNQCESRKISYLGDTQNTISYRHNNRKKSTKSAFPCEQISELLNVGPSRKSKSQYRSQAVSPNGKKLVSNKKGKILSSKNIGKGKQLINGLIDDSQDNIIGYTHQSSQFQHSANTKSLEDGNSAVFFSKDKTSIRKLILKSESPILEEQRGIIYGIREMEKTAQFKKQHLNYEYLKEKVLVLASVKKIQRAWRNYKTRKLIKSYSNNISLKFTGKMKNQLLDGQQPQEIKILTVRSCGYAGGTNQLKRQAKKNLSLLHNDDLQSSQQQQWDSKNNQQVIIHRHHGHQTQKSKKFQQKYKSKQKSVRSAIAQFQMEQIKKWQELIKNIKQGKKVDQVLEKSFRRKEQLQKQLSNNLKDISGSEKGESYSVKSRDQEKSQERDFKKKDHHQFQTIEAKNSEAVVHSQPSVSSQSSLPQKLLCTKYQSGILDIEHKLKSIDISQQQQGATTQRRRQKLEYFQNQLRKIDNEYSENSGTPHSVYSESSVYYGNGNENSSSDQVVLKGHGGKDMEFEENLKLKKKIQAINRIQMFNCQEEEVEDPSESKYLYTSLQKVQERPKRKTKSPQTPSQSVIQQVYQQQNGQFFPLTLHKPPIQSQQPDDGRLQTFRNKNYLEVSRTILYDDMRLKELRKRKMSWAEKEELVSKIEEEILYDLLLEFSERDGFISKMESLYLSVKKGEPEVEKPEGICTNLESIKDYLQNFVAFVFEQQPGLLMQGFNQPKGPDPTLLLPTFRNIQIDHKTLYPPILSLKLFEQHWLYASQQIYFDAKYTTDPSKEKERVRYLKEITKMYFRAIFDGFNQCLEPYRVYQVEGKPLPWQINLRNKPSILGLPQIKPLIRMGYRKLSQISIIYCGLLFQDKKHSMSQKMIQQIQKQRLDTLIEIELLDEEQKWKSIRVERTEVMYRVGEVLWEGLVLEVCREVLGI